MTEICNYDFSTDPLAADFTTVDAGLSVSGGLCSAVAGDDQENQTADAPWPADQYAETTLIQYFATSDERPCGLVIRGQDGSGQARGYRVMFHGAQSPGDIDIDEWQDDTFGWVTRASVSGITTAPGDVLYIEAVTSGSDVVVTVKLNGAGIGLSWTDSPARHAGGNPGMVARDGISQWTDFRAGSVAAGSTYTLTADAGAVAVAGTDAAFELTVPGDAGAYAITGYDADLLRALLLTAGAGTVTVTGTAATLTTGTGQLAHALGAARFTPTARLRSHGSAGRGLRR